MASNQPDLSNGKEVTPISCESSILKSLDATSFESMQCDEDMTTVIRIKRKRVDEPAEALLLACKKLKHDEHFKGNNGMADIIQIEENVFHFATTLKSNSRFDENLKDKVKNAISLRNKLNVVYGKNRKTQEPTKSQRPLTEKKVIDTMKHKLKNIVHSHNERLTKKNINVQPSHSAAAPLPTKKIYKPSTARKRSAANVAAVALESGENLKPKYTSNPDDIYCNSAKMFREKLNISEVKEDDYVYDVYYCQKAQPNWNVKNILYIKSCRHLDFVYESPEEDTTQYEDDDDSNDEDNWRNDYPDEDDSIDEDERRIIFDEEEDLYDTDDCDFPAHDDDDAYNSFMTSGGCGYEDGAADNYDDFSYAETFANEPGPHQFADYNNDQTNHRGGKD